MSAARKKRSVIVENATAYPTAEVARIVRFALREAGVNEAMGAAAHRVVVKVKHHNGPHPCHGHIYYHPSTHGVQLLRRRAGGYDEWVTIEPKVPPGTKHLIVCNLVRPGACTWPNTTANRPEQLDVPISSWQEALVTVAAHEGYHLWSYEKAALRRRAGKPKQSEVECEMAGQRVLARWRARQATKEGVTA